MIWNVLKRDTLEVQVPKDFTRHTMYPFIAQAIDDNADARCNRVVFDFEKLGWIEPAGVVVLSNLFEYLIKLGAKVSIKNHSRDSEPIRYLDDSGLFERYIGKKVFPSSAVRNTTVPLHLVKKERVFQFLESELLPWIGGRVNLVPDSLATIKMCLEEVFLNIDHHSEVKIGCSFAQHYPQKRLIHIVVSDFGVGIPTVVRRKRPELDDKAAIWQACQEGFSTKSNVRNRGAGLPNLMRYVTLRNRGTVIIASGRGDVSAVEDFGKIKITTRSAAGFYPGTFVQVILRTDTLEQVAEDVQQEDFLW
jgi:hypothetical protein